MFFARVKIYPFPGHQHDIVDVLESIKGPIGTLADCLGCSVAVETDEGGAVCYTEHWQTREALHQHLRSPLYGRLLGAIECSCLPPVIEFYEVQGVGGLELIEEIRGRH